MKVFLLIVLIAVLGGFIYIKLQALGSPDSNFNQTTRYTLGKYPTVRSVFGLHSFGDARGEFLSPGGPIALEVVTSRGVSIDERSLNEFAQYIKTYTGRSVVVFDSGKAKEGTLTEKDLDQIASDKRIHAGWGQPSLLLIYASDYDRKGGEVARTYKEFGIVMSDKRLREVTAGYTQSFEQYITSTFLHELGHQLGLDHNNEQNCIMNPQVEQPEFGSVFTGFFTYTKFCDLELNQLKAIKAGI